MKAFRSFICMVAKYGKEIQTAMKASNVCQIHHTIPGKPLIIPRRNTPSPWVRTFDFAGLFFWKYIFDCVKNICLLDCLIVSKCIESIQIRNIKSSAALSVWEKLFFIVSDNGPSFSSQNLIIFANRTVVNI